MCLLLFLHIYFSTPNQPPPDPTAHSRSHPVHRVTWPVFRNIPLRGVLKVGGKVFGYLAPWRKDCGGIVDESHWEGQ